MQCSGPSHVGDSAQGHAAPRGPRLCLVGAAVMLLLLLRFLGGGHRQGGQLVAGVLTRVSLCRCFAGGTGAELLSRCQGWRAASAELLQPGAPRPPRPQAAHLGGPEGNAGG